MNSSNGRRLSWREYWLRNSFGLSLADWDEMLIAQSGRCALCSEPMMGGRDPVVDHAYQTGKIRGLLHHRCNIGLAYVEAVGFRVRALAYLETHQGKVVAVPTPSLARRKQERFSSRAWMD